MSGKLWQIEQTILLWIETGEVSDIPAHENLSEDSHLTTLRAGFFTVEKSTDYEKEGISQL